MVSQNYTGVNFLSRRNIENWHETPQPGDVTLENVINVFVSRLLKKVRADCSWLRIHLALYRLTNAITASCKISTESINSFGLTKLKLDKNETMINSPSHGRSGGIPSITCH